MKRREEQPLSTRFPLTTFSRCLIPTENEDRLFNSEDEDEQVVVAADVEAERRPFACDMMRRVRCVNRKNSKQKADASSKDPRQNEAFARMKDVQQKRKTILITFFFKMKEIFFFFVFTKNI